MAATDEVDQVLELIRKLIRDKKSFSISVEKPESLNLQIAARISESDQAIQGEGTCVKWVYVAGEGMVCVEHA